MKNKFLNCVFLLAIFSVLFTAASISFVFSVSLHDIYSKVLPVTLTIMVILTGIYMGLLKYFHQAAEKMLFGNQHPKGSGSSTDKDFALLEAEKRERARIEMYSNISHEMKTPLTTIRGYAEMMENRMVPEEDIPHIAAKMNEESCCLIAMIDRVMDSMRHPDAEAVLNKEVFEMKKAAAAVAERLRPRAEEKHMEITVAGEPLLLDCNKELYDQICYNLIDNAIKYSREGGSVQVSVEMKKECKCLRITDHGIGISEEDQKRVFERFFRSDRSHSRKVEGTGLGLPIVKHYVDLLGAELVLNSVLGKGTEICILFYGA